MKIGLQVPSFSWPGGSDQIGPRLAEVSSLADSLGFASIWVMDHFFQIRSVGQPEEPMLESYSTLNFIAAHTHTAKLGTLVTGVIYRNPGLLVKAVTTLDVLSGGRAYLGIGAAWNEMEARGLGFGFPPLKERFEQLEDALKIARAMWAGDDSPFDGKHIHMERPLNRPQVISKPHPPILIGGGGEKKTLRLVAQYADACNLFAALGTEEIARKLDVLKRYCDESGRDYKAIEKTALGTYRGEPVKEFLETCRKLNEVGIQHLILNMPGATDPKVVEVLGKEIIPAVAGF